MFFGAIYLGLASLLSACLYLCRCISVSNYTLHASLSLSLFSLLMGGCAFGCVRDNVRQVGSFGAVGSAIDSRTGEEVAIKKIQNPFFLNRIQARLRVCARSLFLKQRAEPTLRSRSRLPDPGLLMYATCSHRCRNLLSHSDLAIVCFIICLCVRMGVMQAVEAEHRAAVATNETVRVRAAI